MASLWSGQCQGQWEGRLIGPIDPNFLNGTTGFSVAASGLVRGAGILSGQAYFALDAAGNIEDGNTTTLAYGTASLGLSASGTVIGALLASGSASIILDAQGDAYLAANTGGGAALSVMAAGSLRGLGAVLGSGEVALGAQASLTGIGALAGTSGISVLPNGNIFSPLWTSGQTGIALGVTGGINGAAWATGGTSVEIQSQGLLYGVGALAGAAWFVLRARHRDLTHYQRAYVTSVVESLFAQTVADQIVSVASLNNLSVMDAIQSVTAKYSVEPFVVLDERKLRVKNPARTYAPKQEKAPATNRPMYSISDDIRITACATSETEFVVSRVQTLTTSTGSNQIFIQHKPKRSALEQSSIS